MRRVDIHPTRGKNAMSYWYTYVNPWRVMFNFAVIYACRFIPFLSLKRFMYRMVGVRIGRDVSVGLGAMFDIFFPQLISIGDNSTIGYNCTLLAHEFLVGEWRTGSVDIGRDVVLGLNTTVLPGVRIGDSAVVSACSLVNDDVPAGAFYGGVPARPIRRGNLRGR